MKNYKKVTIAAAKEIAQKFDKTQVIIVCWDDTHKKMHVTTYGKSLLDCEQAAVGGNFIKRALGWPEDQCNAIPRRIKRKKEKQNDNKST